MAETINMPKLGLQMTSGLITKWLVKEGDSVEKGQPVFSIETDKITSDVEATCSGVILKILVSEGETAKVSDPCCYVGSANESIPAEGAPASSPEPAPAAETKKEEAEPAAEKAEPAVSGARKFISPAARATAKELGVDVEQVKGTGPNGRVQKQDVIAFFENSRVKVTPVARKLAAEYGISLDGIQGSGPNGRIQKQDVLAAYEQSKTAGPAAAAAAPQSQPETGSEEDDSYTERVTSMRRVIAQRLTESKRNAPHIYFDVDVDASEMVAIRNQFKEASARKNGKALTYNDIIVKATVTALTEFPQVNATFEGDVIRYFKHVNIGVATSLPNGLVVPVVRKADELTLSELSAQIAKLVAKAKGGKLLPDDMTGGCFTVSNVGNIGVDCFHAIINPPESGILAVSSMIEKPYVVNHQLEVRPVIHMSGSFDHRMIDGAVAGQFMARIKALLENPSGLFF